MVDVIATLGPASDRLETWAQMLAAGATGFRLNTSHLTLDALDGWLERLQAFFSARGDPRPPLVLDLQGSKWRLGQIAPRELAAGEQVELALAPELPGSAVLPVPHADFFLAAQAGGEVALNDAKVRLVIDLAGPERVTARVTQPGPLAANKGITLPGSSFRVERLGEKDRAILRRAAGLDFVRCAVSYVQDATEMAGYRALVERAVGRPVSLIAKLERRPAVDEPELVAQHAGELWLCRGDLGAELGLPGMAVAARDFALRVRSLPAPALLAGQVLEHLTVRPVPTRSEITAMYDALAHGYRGFVLSDETAVGPHPVEACRAAAMFK